MERTILMIQPITCAYEVELIQDVIMVMRNKDYKSPIKHTTRKGQKMYSCRVNYEGKNRVCFFNEFHITFMDLSPALDTHFKILGKSSRGQSAFITFELLFNEGITI